ncbi:MAG: hypothetical protein KDI34_23010, partial [Halioglobus sp.]|nr:hypothetical protein [Halioglobus sp.]
VKSNELTNLHNELYNLCVSFRTVFTEPEFVGLGYKPHVTVKKNGRLANDKKSVDIVTLVEVTEGDEKTGIRKVVKEFLLG